MLLWRNVFSFIIYLKNKNIIDLDLKRYLPQSPYTRCNVLSLNYVLLFIKPFRSIFKYRAKKNSMIMFLISFLSPKPIDTIEIIGDIQGGLLVYHKMGCVIYCNKAGENLSVAQGVTIGKGHKNEHGKDTPTIGNNVRIGPNAVIVGPISIGNNVRVGANTFLKKSVPDNSVVVGNPARIIRMNGIECDIKL